MSSLIILPIGIPLITAIITLFLRGSLAAQRAVSLVGALALLGSTLLLGQAAWQDGIQVMQMGGWPAPFGITFVADLLSVIMLVVTGIIAVATVIYSFANIDENRVAFGFYPFLNLLLVGICGSFLTGDMFNLFVWFEVMLISSFILMALGNDKPQMEGAFKYVAVNLVSSALFLAGIGLLYGVTGTLNMADLAHKIPQVQNQGVVTMIAMFFLVSFGIKAAVFPLFFWLPASYHTPPTAVAAIFAGMLTKVGVYAILRVFTLMFTNDIGYTHTLMLWIAGFTMVVGVLGAAAQSDIRKILSVHIVSQIGYMIMGIGLMSVLVHSDDEITRAGVRLALAGTIFYIVHNIIVKANLFFVGGVIARLGGSFELKNLGGLYRYFPFVAVLFVIPAFSLAGLPPLSGFWAKLMVIKAGLDLGSYWIVGTALFVGLLTLYSMAKIWAGAFLPKAQEGLITGPLPAEMKRSVLILCFPIAILAALSILMGLFMGPIFELTEAAADQLLNPNFYIQAVLGR
jgi:multicomponent Na+:H+ antiporter subunit D